MPRRRNTDNNPHPSHDMTKWKGGIVGSQGGRFGEERECTGCGLEQWRHAAGSGYRYGGPVPPCSAAEAVDRRGPFTRFRGDNRWWLHRMAGKTPAEWRDLIPDILTLED